jgi:DNA repair exonuclease SbcCD nuclease subunit
VAKKSTSSKTDLVKKKRLIAILGDTHIGARGAAEHFVHYFSEFFERVFVPYLIKHNIKTVIQLGDLFDKRTSCNVFALQEFRRVLLDRLQELGIELIIMCGNHDVYFKNTNTVNSPETLVDFYPNLKVFSETAEIDVQGETFLILPWINKENYQASLEAIQKTKAKICCGHLELSGFKMYKTAVNETGMDAELFKKFEMTFSGHFHHRSQRGDIHYVGTPYEMTWDCWNDQKGFHTLDLDTRTLTFVENPLHMFYVVKYSDDYDPAAFDDSLYANRIIKIFVDQKLDPVMFESFYQRLVQCKPADLIIIERAPELTMTENIEVATMTTSQVVDSYIDNLNTDKDKPRLKKLMQELYKDAMNMGA